MLMAKAKDPSFWQKVRNDSAYSEIRALIRSWYDANRCDRLLCLPYKARMRFYKDGDRAEFGKAYFSRRTFLGSAAFLSLIYPEETKYLDEVQECIWAICCEYSWALSAHTNGTLDDDLHRIDLFSAETGFTLAEICYVLEDRLDKLVLDRARSEVRSRVIDNYINRRFGWESNPANWSAVCAGNVGGAMMYLEPEIFDKQLPRLLDTMRCFLSGFPNDGTCLEGFGYWHYGFGNFLWFADLLYQYTNGKTDLLTWEKVDAISAYAQRTFLLGGTVVTNADAGGEVKADRAMITYLHQRFPDRVQQLPKSLTTYCKRNLTWMYPLRSLIYADHSADHTEFQLQDVILPDAGQAVLHRKGYSFAIKAGHNHEPHNHNDVGSFILSTDKGQIFCDLGSGLYTRQYFQDETRYGIFCNSSLSHSVPIVNGQPQRYGDEYNGTIAASGNRIIIDFPRAYGQPQFRTLRRTVLCEDGLVTLTDVFDPTYESLCERFVTLHKPEVLADRVLVNGVILSFARQNMSVSVKEVLHQPQSASLPAQTVYCIDFELLPGLSDATFTFRITED